jgi:hypothetical protein
VSFNDASARQYIQLGTSYYPEANMVNSKNKVKK